MLEFVVDSQDKNLRLDAFALSKMPNFSRSNIKKQIEDGLILLNGKTVKAGTPTVKNAVCEAEVIAHGKDDKIVVFKYKPKKNERKKQGHRQPFTRVKILSVK